MQFKASQRLRNPNEEHLNFDERADTDAAVFEQANYLPTTSEQDRLLQQSQLNVNERANTVAPSQSNRPPTSVDMLQQLYPVHDSTL
uniref:Uncharacterized protein n=1 Tax=Panagrolaimus superbus TaxID=310955 RepID=A0A914YLU0_9BILA